MERRSQTILCAIDFSEFTDLILAFGTALAKTCPARLALVHVTVDVNTLLKHHETNLDVNRLQQTNLREASQELEALAKDLPVACEIIVSQGDPADAMNKLARDKQADLVISATHGRSGFKRLLLGSVTEKLLKTLPCPLLVLPAHDHGSASPDASHRDIAKILVGCDFSADSNLAVERALDLARAFQAELHLAHVIKPALYQDKREAVEDLRSRLGSQLDTMVPDTRRDLGRIESILLEGEPSTQLIHAAEERGIDMIVLGIHGHTLLEKLLVGSTTDRIIRQANLPVLAVRQPSM